MYRTQSSSTYTFFSQQAVRAGLPYGNFAGGARGHAEPEMFRKRSDMRESIQRELEKERIRVEIIAEEMARWRELEAEVRRELMMERAMSGGGFTTPFMPLSLPLSHNSLYEPIMPHRQPIGLEERIAMSLEERCGGGSHRPEIRGLEVHPLQRFGDMPKIKEIPAPFSEDSKKKVIVLAKPNGATLSGAKQKSTPPVASASDGSKKKLKEEWSCAICQVTATSERGLNEHLNGKKHQAREAALIAQKTGANFGLGVAPKKPIIVKPLKLALTTTDPNPSVKRLKMKRRSFKNSSKFELNDLKNGKVKKDKFKFWCEMCGVGAFSQKVMNNHNEGKRHLTKLLELDQTAKPEPEPEPAAGGGTETCGSEEKTEIEDETKKDVENERI